jgi:protein-tyrosine phosphatase
MLIAWAPDCAVSMTGLDEMLRKDAGGFPDDLREAGIEWLHLPIEDFGSPADAIIAGWEQTSADLRGCLAEGGRVLVHCYGGCGRSGMIALRLMIDAGEAADAALARLRAVRPCAVETDGQMAWARGG